MTLAEAIEQIERCDEDAVIFAKKPWSPTTEAMIAPLDDDSGVPSTIKEAGFAYFLEAPLVTEVLEVFGERPPAFDEKLRLLLHYAENDAYPEWAFERSE